MSKLIIKIKSLEDLKTLRKGLGSMRFRILQFQGIVLLKLANQIVIDEVQKRMKAADFSQKIIDNTSIVDVQLIGKLKARLIFKSELFTDTGFDIALAREEGTSKHELPKVEGRTYSWIDENGKRLFSKGHEVDGILALHIIADTLDEMTAPLQDEYNRELRDFVENNIKGVTAAI